MNWLFDLGNTRLKWMAADADAHDSPVQSLANADLGNPAWDSDVLFSAIAPGSIAWLASVAPAEVTATVLDRLWQRGIRVMRVQTQTEFAGVRIAYASASDLGADRFLSLVATHALGGTRPWLIASVGTALTIDLLHANGRHLGGLIAPSPDLMRQTLAQRAPHLPATGGMLHDFCDNTSDALASGCIFAARALIERSLAAAQRELAVIPGLLLTGGGADALGDQWPVAVHREPNLVLHGLRLWMQTSLQASPPLPASSR